MKNIILAALCALLCSLGAGAQTPAPTPPAAADEEDVVKISTSLIQLDVTVTDSKGNVVRDLRPEDFEVYENGEKQRITSFSFVSSARAAETPAAAAARDDRTAVPVPPAELRADKVRRTFALVVDDLSLSFESAYQTRRALKKFVDEQMRDGDLVAIIRTGAGIGALQQFTSDRRQLYAAIEKVKWNPIGSGRLGAFAPVNDSARIQNDNESEDQRRDRENSENAFEDFQDATFATGTLGALRFIVAGMNELPGRKSVILFSDGFSLVQRNETGFTESSRIMEFLRQLVDLANRSSVVIYTIDSRGLQTAGIGAEDDVQGTPERAGQVLSQRSRELFETQAGPAFLAEETGGFAIRNSNDLSGGVRRVLDDQSYYLLGYEPDSETFDAKTRRYNRLEIKVKNKDYKVRYRSGFFNVAERDGPRPATAAAAETPAQQIQRALTSPFAVNEIALRLNALYGNNAAQGDFVRPLLHIDAQDLKFTDAPDGKKKAVFDILAVIYGDNGTVVDQLSKTATLTVPPATYDAIRKNGLVYYFTLPVKKAGAYQFRVALRDSQAGKVGSASQFIEVPNLKKERLTASSIVLENLTEAQWRELAGRPLETDGKAAAEAPADRPDPMTDTSLRRFRRGTILRFGYEIYNARLDAAKKFDLSTRIRVFRDGRLVLDGRPAPVEAAAQADPQRVRASGAIDLANAMEPGDYVLQVVVTDNLAKEKRRLATQFVQFEVTP